MSNVARLQESADVTIAKDEKMDIDDTGGLQPSIEALPAATEVDNTQTGYRYPASFGLAVQVTFSMLSHFFKSSLHHTWDASTLQLAILRRSIPWPQLLVFFFITVSSNVMLARVLTSQQY